MIQQAGEKSGRRIEYGRIRQDCRLMFLSREVCPLTSVTCRAASSNSLAMNFTAAASGRLPHEELQRIFMDALPPDVELYGEYHALILVLCKDSCRKAGCGEVCKKLGSNHENQR